MTKMEILIILIVSVFGLIFATFYDIKISIALYD